MKRIWTVILISVFIATLNGCAVNFYKGKPEQAAKIRELSAQVEDLEQAKRLLEDRLFQEIADKQVLLEKTSRGLIITMANDILFDSGKAKLKSNAYSMLKKIATVLNENVADRDVGVEGHTDNVPIKHSGWKSNWELSTARATSVLHYLIDECSVAPQRLSAIGYGEFRPVDTNETRAGKARNRRVEIIILPKEITKKSYEETTTRVSEEAKTAEESKSLEESVK
ncbi:MAG: OmpA family protein [Candidatus Omnitrophota bacterium]